jgi:hypothetical protein
MKSKLRDRDEFDSHYEDRVRAPARMRGPMPPAGVYLYAGRYEVAPHHSEAERRLREAGALHVATVTFDGLPIAAVSGGGARDLRFADLVAVSAHDAVRELEPAHN